MKPTQILAEEHRVIEQVLDCLERMAEECQTSGHLDASAAKAAVDFFRAFADRCHHGKEEVHLFPAMEAKGFSAQCGPTAVMRLEHEQGRAHVRAMDEAIPLVAAGDAAGRGKFVEHARAYLELLRQHIQKEDHCLFTMADQAFSEADQQQLLAAFHHVEADEMGSGTHEKYLRIAEELAERFGVAKAAALSHHACCGH